MIKTLLYVPFQNDKVEWGKYLLSMAQDWRSNLYDVGLPKEYLPTIIQHQSMDQAVSNQIPLCDEETQIYVMSHGISDEMQQNLYQSLGVKKDLKKDLFVASGIHCLSKTFFLSVEDIANRMLQDGLMPGKKGSLTVHLYFCDVSEKQGQAHEMAKAFRKALGKEFASKDSLDIRYYTGVSVHLPHRETGDLYAYKLHFSQTKDAFKLVFAGPVEDFQSVLSSDDEEMELKVQDEQQKTQALSMQVSGDHDTMSVTSSDEMDMELKVQDEQKKIKGPTITQSSSDEKKKAQAPSSITPKPF